MIIRTNLCLKEEDAEEEEEEPRNIVKTNKVERNTANPENTANPVENIESKYVNLIKSNQITIFSRE